MKIAFMHTLAANIELFTPYIRQYLPDIAVQHFLHEELLKEAMRGGITPQLRRHVAQAIETIAQQGADIIVSTCSTIGALAEETQLNNCSVLRVDRPMAAAAVQHQRILVVAVLASTLVPTLALLEQIKGTRTARIDSVLIPDAWTFYQAGDAENFARSIARYINALKTQYDVIVFAQASMVPALAYCSSAPGSILTSPELCLQYLHEKMISNA